MLLSNFCHVYFSPENSVLRKCYQMGVNPVVFSSRSIRDLPEPMGFNQQESSGKQLELHDCYSSLIINHNSKQSTESRIIRQTRRARLTLTDLVVQAQTHAHNLFAVSLHLKSFVNRQNDSCSAEFHFIELSVRVCASTLTQALKNGIVGDMWSQERWGEQETTESVGCFTAHGASGRARRSG